VIVLGGSAEQAVALVASVTPDFTAKVQAGKVIRALHRLSAARVAASRTMRAAGQGSVQAGEALQKARMFLTVA
jgi:alanyl-tRNA synthetase